MSAGRALVVAHWLPEGDRESGLRRVSDTIDMLLRADWDVTFGCLFPRDRERYVRQLEQRGVETYAPLRRLDKLPDPGGFDLAIFAYWHVARRLLPDLRRVAPSTPAVVDSVDLHFVREMREKLRPEAGSAPGQLETKQATKLIDEINTYAAADAVLTVSEKEAALINDLTARPDLALTLPDTEELPRSDVRLRDRRGILFLGNFLHPPNRDAAAYFCREVIPRVDSELLAEHPVLIVGTGAEEHQEEFSRTPYIKTVGWVPSVLPYLRAARISVVPLRFGAGTKRKVVQTLMSGTPVVTTSVGAEGLDVRDGREALIADEPHEFAAAIERLLRSGLTWRRLARRGRHHALRSHGRATVQARFEHVLEDVVARSPRAPVAQPGGDDGVARSPEYARLVARVREAVESDVPQEARVLVATRGDDALLAFEGRRGWHFPRDRDGGYAGFHPKDDEAAIAHLEELRAEGATHLVLPETDFWWLAYYEGFAKHLDSAYRRIRSDAHMIVYDLAGEGAGRPRGTTLEVTPQLVDSLQPSALAEAERYRPDGDGRRALVLGVYLAGKPNTAEHIAATIAESAGLEVDQRWVALGGDPPDGQLGSVTALTVGEPTPKYALLNRLLADTDLAGYDYVLTTDDDIILPKGFLDLYLGVQAAVGFDLAQPARTANSHVDHPIVVQQRGVLARRTLFVEIGPLVSFGREIYDLVFPFDETSPMGWGFENVWSYRLRERDRPQGIVDAVPVDHSIRPPVAHYEWSDADTGRDRYLAQNPHLRLDDCFRVLEVVGVDG